MGLWHRCGRAVLMLKSSQKARDSISRMCKWYHSRKSDDDEGSLLLSSGDNSVFIWPLGGQRL